MRASHSRFQRCASSRSWIPVKRNHMVLTLFIAAGIYILLPWQLFKGCPAARKTELEVQDVRTEYDVPEPFLDIMMAPDEQVFLKELVASTSNWFEWGLGGSTSQAIATKNIRRIHSVESDQKWYDKLYGFEQCKKALSINRLRLVHANIGEVKHAGYPKDDVFSEQWKVYPNELWNANEDIWLSIFVDGRFRVACTLTAVEYIVKHGLMYDDTNNEASYASIMIHDYNEKRKTIQNYSFVEKYLELEKQVNTLAQFRVNKKTIVGMDNFHTELKADQDLFYSDPL